MVVVMAWGNGSCGAGDAGASEVRTGVAPVVMVVIRGEGCLDNGGGSE